MLLLYYTTLYRILYYTLSSYSILLNIYSLTLILVHAVYTLSIRLLLLQHFRMRTLWTRWLHDFLLGPFLSPLSLPLRLFLLSFR